MSQSTTQILRTGTLRAMGSQKSSAHQRFTCIVIQAKPSLPLNLLALELLLGLAGIMSKAPVILPHHMPFWRRYLIILSLSFTVVFLKDISSEYLLWFWFHFDRNVLGKLDAQSLYQTVTLGKTRVQML